MNENTFQQNLKYWYNKSKLALNHREDKKEELLKRLELLEYGEQNPDFDLSMVNHTNPMIPNIFFNK